MSYIGIDPGTAGGIAILFENHGEPDFHRLDLSKVTEQDIVEFLRQAPDVKGCVIERVGPNRQRRQGERAQGASSMFTFGRGYGFLRGALHALGIPFVEAAPTKWQMIMQVKGPADEGTTVKKNRHKARAQQLYPGVSVQHWKADALLLATYCRQKHAELF